MTHGRCYFVDVGQGTANVIILKGRRALVIDAGPSRNASVHRLLKDLAGTIECVVISHHDRDHIRGWERIAVDFQKNIGAVWCLPDANVDEGKRVDVTMNLAERGLIPMPGFAGVDSLAAGKTIWKDDQSPLQLDLLYPDQFGMIEAMKAKKPNRASAVAVLRCGDAAIVFPGDSEMDAWRRLKDESPHLPLKADVVAVPHHGGMPGGTDGELRWLYRDAVPARVAIFSAGSANDEGHPRPEVMESLRAAGVRIMCTQITPQCDAKLELLRPGVIKPLPFYSESTKDPSFTNSAKRSRHVGCAGTVAADLEDQEVRVTRVNEHYAAVKSKVGTPLCLG